MSEMSPLPSYTDLTDALEKTQSPLHASEVHGLICGIICIAEGGAENQWETLVEGPKKNKQSTELLRQLYTASFEEISQFSFEFALLLPETDTDINSRAECLGFWCQGFLTGLEQASTSIEERTSEEVKDALNDLTEIAQVQYEDIASTDEDETAYFELVEYVRLVVLMIYHDLNTEAPPGEENLLH